MADGTKIEWTEATWNPVRARNRETGRLGWHCTHVSQGCSNCYAEAMNRWRGTGLAYKPGHEGDVEIFVDDRILTQPLRWKRSRMIFVCSMTDLFADFVTDEMIDRVIAVMALARRHTFQVLTKRPERMRAYLTNPDLNNRISAALGCMLDGDWIWNKGRRFRDEIERLIEVFLGEGTDDHGDIVHHDDPMPLPNVWLGTSVEDQATADARIPELLRTPAAVWWLSAEPLLGPLKLTNVAPPSDGYGGLGHGIDALSRHNRILRGVLGWVVVGFESGPKARARPVRLIRDIVRQCKAAAVPVFVKQLGPKVIDRNDAGFDGCDPTAWDVDEGRVEHNIHGYLDEAQGTDCLIKLRDRKGGDWSEWPEDLRVREFPEVRHG